MKDKKLEEYKEKYFDGLSSLEEEQELKNSDDVFFNTLKEEKNSQMNWSFDEFLEEQEAVQPKVIKLWQRSWFKWSVAAVLLMGIAVGIFQKQETPVTRTAMIEPLKTKKVVEPIQKEEIDITDHPAKDRIEPATVAVHKLAKITSKRNIEKESVYDHGAINPNLEENLAYQADYVLVNGKPVENEEEAVALTLKSLGLLANNLEEGVDKAMNIKQMSITIN